LGKNDKRNLNRSRPTQPIGAALIRNKELERVKKSAKERKKRSLGLPSLGAEMSLRDKGTRALSHMPSARMNANVDKSRKDVRNVGDEGAQGRNKKWSCEILSTGA